MYQHNLVVRWNNGELEGFSGYGFSPLSAHDNVLAKAERKAKDFGLTFNVVSEAEYGNLSKECKDIIKSDWEISQRSEVI